MFAYLLKVFAKTQLLEWHIKFSEWIECDCVANTKLLSNWVRCTGTISKKGAWLSRLSCYVSNRSDIALSIEVQFILILFSRRQSAQCHWKRITFNVITTLVCRFIWSSAGGTAFYSNVCHSGGSLRYSLRLNVFAKINVNRALWRLVQWTKKTHLIRLNNENRCRQTRIVDGPIDTVYTLASFMPLTGFMRQTFWVFRFFQPPTQSNLKFVTDGHSMAISN